MVATGASHHEAPYCPRARRPSSCLLVICLRANASLMVQSNFTVLLGNATVCSLPIRLIIVALSSAPRVTRLPPGARVDCGRIFRPHRPLPRGTTAGQQLRHLS